MGVFQTEQNVQRPEPCVMQGMRDAWGEGPRHQGHAQQAMSAFSIAAYLPQLHHGPS